MIKSWEKTKQDPYSFSKCYEDLIEKQRSDVVRAFLGLDSPYSVRPEFSDQKIEFAEFARLSAEEKKLTSQKLANVLVDAKRYSQVKGWRDGPDAVNRVRLNICRRFQSEPPKSATVDTDAATFVPVAEAQTTTKELLPAMQATIARPFDGTVTTEEPDTDFIAALTSAIIDARPWTDPNSVQSTVSKAYLLAKNGSLTQAFADGVWFVKSSTSPTPHVVTQNKGTDSIACDKACLHFRDEQMCAHAIAVAITTKSTQSYAGYLARTQITMNHLASANVNTSTVGKKKPVRKRKPARNSGEIAPKLLPLPTLNRLGRLPTPTANTNTAGIANYPQPMPISQQNYPNVIHRPLSMHNPWLNPMPQHQPLSIFTGKHADVLQGQFVLTLLQVCDSRVHSCQGNCDTSLKAMNHQGEKTIPDAPKDLVILTKMRREYYENGVRKESNDVRNTYFHCVNKMNIPFHCLARKVPNFRSDFISLDMTCMPYLNDIHYGFILFYLNLNHLAPYMNR